MKAELKKEFIKNSLDTIEQIKKLHQTMKVILLEDEINGTSLFCHLNCKTIYDMRILLEQIISEFVQLHDPNIKVKTLTIRN
jgi:hypothetical protein